MGDYNGWSNYETWCVSLWLSNDEGLYMRTRDMAEEIANEEEPYKGYRRRVLSEALKDWCEEFPEVEAVQSQASFVSDLFGAAWSEVDWLEIADNLLSEVPA